MYGSSPLIMWRGFFLVGIQEKKKIHVFNCYCFKAVINVIHFFFFLNADLLTRVQKKYI